MGTAHHKQQARRKGNSLAIRWRCELYNKGFVWPVYWVFVPGWSFYILGISWVIGTFLLFMVGPFWVHANEETRSGPLASALRLAMLRNLTLWLEGCGSEPCDVRRTSYEETKGWRFSSVLRPLVQSSRSMWWRLAELPGWWPHRHAWLVTHPDSAGGGRGNFASGLSRTWPHGFYFCLVLHIRDILYIL